MSIETTPWGFAEGILGLSLYDWQGEVLDAFDDPTCYYSLVAANGSGKTERIFAPLVWYFGTMFSNATIVTTSASNTQLEDQMWKNILKYKHMFPDVKSTLTSLSFPNGSQAVGLSTNDAGKFEGFHTNGTAPLIILADESKSIKEFIFTAMDRCQPTHVLLASSAGKKAGTFFKTFTNPELGYQTKRITYKDCPHISPEWYEKMYNKWSKGNHPYFRSMFYSEFYGEDGDVYVIPPQLLEELKASKIVKQTGLKFAFIDLALGGDETVVAIMEGNFIHELLCFVDSNTKSTVNRCIAHLKKHKVPFERVWVDAGGIGKPIADEFDAQEFFVGRVNNGSGAFQKKVYFNRGAEIWWDARQAFEDRKIILPDDEILFEQLSNRLIAYKDNGLLGVEPKDEMREERGVSSPDRADAVCGVISMAKYMPKLKTPEERMMEEFEKDEIDERRGWHTG